MEDSYLYHQIAESIRHAILEGQLKPGDRLPSVRKMMQQWQCTPGTVQRAYQELAQQGLVVSRPGQGTHVTNALPQHRAQAPLRRAALVNRAEAFLLEALTAGYRLEEIQQAVDLAKDRWQTLEQTPPPPAGAVLRFHGSHDLAITHLAAFLAEITPGASLELNFSGSLAGLMALAEGRADLAGCHLWDEESDSYNIPFVRRLLPGKRTAVVTLAHRHLGLIVSPGNPLGLTGLADLARPAVQFVNRQSGSGTRVWLDAQLTRLGVLPGQIHGYSNEQRSHSAVARQVAEGQANAGLGLEQAARTYGLDFIFLTRERYDLVLLAAALENPALGALLDWLSTPAARQALSGLSGYDLNATGQTEYL